VKISTWTLLINLERPGKRLETLPDKKLRTKKHSKRNITRWLLKTTLTILLKLTPRNGTIQLQELTWWTEELLHLEVLPTNLILNMPKSQLLINQELLGKRPEMPPELPLLSKRDSKRNITKWLQRTTLMILLKQILRNGTMPPQELTWWTVELLHSEPSQTQSLIPCMLNNLHHNNISMDLIQSTFTRPTEPTQTETTRLLKSQLLWEVRSNKDGNQKETPTTGPKKPKPDNLDGQMKLTHGLKSLTSDLATICKNLNLFTPV